MKPSDFASALTNAAKFSASNELELIASALADSTSATLAAHLKACEASISSGPFTVEDAVRDLTRLNSYVVSFGAAAFAKDVAALYEVARKCGATSTEELAHKLRTLKQRATGRSRDVQVDAAAVASYVRRFEDALGDDPGFKALIAELQANKAVGKAEATLIAKVFVGLSSKSRADAIKRIAARHDALMAQRAKSESRDGRSAA